MSERNILKEKNKIFQTVLEKVPELRFAGDSVLREQTLPSTLEEGHKIGKRMESVLLKYREITGLGRGLAAPQIGENKSVFVTFVDNKFDIFINPKIIEKSKKTNFYRELCMSAGIMAADVERPDWVIMEWTDDQGMKKMEKFEGFKARLCQHEESHLRGLLNLDEAVSGGIMFATFDPREEKIRDANEY